MYQQVLYALQVNQSLQWIWNHLPVLWLYTSGSHIHLMDMVCHSTSSMLNQLHHLVVELWVACLVGKVEWDRENGAILGRLLVSRQGLRVIILSLSHWMDTCWPVNVQLWEILLLLLTPPCVKTSVLNLKLFVMSRWTCRQQFEADSRWKCKGRGNSMGTLCSDYLPCTISWRKCVSHRITWFNCDSMENT